jgi:hypothetical protein
VDRALTFVSHEISADRRAEFVASGHRPSSFFPHSLRFLPKAGPDGALLAERTIGRTRPGQHWEIVLYADESELRGLPSELFFDDDVVWHQQQFGLPGQIASANAVLAGDTVWSTAHVSDLVQRIGRRREHKTTVEKRFRGWHAMLLNGLLAFAQERGAVRVRLPRAAVMVANTGRDRWVKPELYQRIYDRDVRRLYRVEATGDWWQLDVAANRDRVVLPALRRTVESRSRIACLAHDLERGLGHVGIDDRLTEWADRTWRRSLAAMLELEHDHRVRGTYNVVGCLLEDVRGEIANGDHALAFHSFDHRTDEDGQLDRCRAVDYRLKGYRVPRSRITPELSDDRLLFHNFEWLAASTRAFETSDAALRNGVVRVPVHLDDFALYRHSLDFDAWQGRAFDLIAASEVTVLALHDCYADRWLPGYARFLERLSSVAELWTIDALAADVTLAAAV